MPERGFLAFVASAIVVGSAVVYQIAQYGESKDLVKRVGKFVKTMARAADLGDAHSGQ